MIAAVNGFHALPRSIEGELVTELGVIRIVITLAIAPAPAQPPKAVLDLREVERCALEAAPASDAQPVSVKRLAALAGYAYSSFFRQAVCRLVEMGLLVRGGHGVRRAADPSPR